MKFRSISVFPFFCTKKKRTELNLTVIVCSSKIFPLFTIEDTRYQIDNDNKLFFLPCKRGILLNLRFKSQFHIETWYFLFIFYLTQWHAFSNVSLCRYWLTTKSKEKKVATKIPFWNWILKSWNLICSVPTSTFWWKIFLADFLTLFCKLMR